MVENPYILTEEESVEQANQFLSQSVLTSDETTTLRSQQFELKDYSIKTNKFKLSIENNASTPKAYMSIPVHTINYKNNNGEAIGYTITIADKRFTDKVIAYNDEGNIDLLAGEDAEFWEDLIAGYIYNKINQNNTLQSENKQSEYLTSLRSSETAVFYHHQVTFRFNWHHSGVPYTDYTPFRGGVRAAAGCNAVAIGMIMAWHEWPLQGAYPRYEKTSSGSIILKNHYPEYKNGTWSLFHPYDYRDEVAPTDPRVREHIANLLAEIGYKLNSNYTSSTLTLAAPSYTPAILQQMGYYCKSTQLENFNAITILNDIKLKCPVFMIGYKATSKGEGGHAYVVSGVITRGKQVGNTTVDTGEPMHIYIKNGNAGSGDGWFNVELFNDNVEPDKTEDGRTEGVLVYPYRFRSKILTGIRPNYNNIGSKNIWRRSNLNSY